MGERRRLEGLGQLGFDFQLNEIDWGSGSEPGQ